MTLRYKFLLPIHKWIDATSFVHYLFRQILLFLVTGWWRSRGHLRWCLFLPDSLKAVIAFCFVLFSQSLQSLQETEESFKRGAELMAEGQFDRALVECMETLNKLDAILCPPYRDYIQCQEGARRCMLTMGNKNFLNGLDN